MATLAICTGGRRLPFRLKTRGDVVKSKRHEMARVANRSRTATQASSAALEQDSFQARVEIAVKDNPDLPRAFIVQALEALAESRDQAAPFVPQSRT